MKPIFKYDMVNRPDVIADIQDRVRALKEMHGSAAVAHRDAVCDCLRALSEYIYELFVRCDELEQEKLDNPDMVPASKGEANGGE